MFSKEDASLVYTVYTQDENGNSIIYTKLKFVPDSTCAFQVAIITEQSMRIKYNLKLKKRYNLKELFRMLITFLLQPLFYLTSQNITNQSICSECNKCGLQNGDSVTCSDVLWKSGREWKIFGRNCPL